MFIYALNFMLGIIVFSNKKSIEISSLEWLIFIVLIFVFLITLKKYKNISITIISFVVGFVWMGLFSQYIINTKIADIYFDKPIVIEGKIDNLPVQTDNRYKFIINTHKPFKSKITLAWYGEDTPELKAGDIWQLLVKLKPVNGYQNMGGFDYEKWLFEKKIVATGYVKKYNNNKIIKQGLSVNRLRQYIKNKINPSLANLEFKGLISSLIIGDRSSIQNKHWDILQATSTTHLSVISGLHIGLIAGLFFVIVQFLWCRLNQFSQTIPAKIIAAYFGIIAAFLYTLIAGFSIPTERALIMASMVFISIILRRQHNFFKLYGLALILVLIKNPFNVFNIGFWLSFYVVGIILYVVSQHRNKSLLYRSINLQLVISIATIPLISWFFTTGSTLSPIANLIAIPTFSFSVIPLSLLGGFFDVLGLSYFANIIFAITNQILILLFKILEYLKDFDFNQWNHIQASTLDLIIFIIAILILILPKGLKLRWMAVAPLALIIFNPQTKLDENFALITTLDVGQGLSHVVQTKNHTLLFDTGNIYPSGFNLGTSVINPYLKFKNIKKLDKIIISHNDKDHIGGLKGVLKEFKANQILASDYKKIPQAKPCISGQKWQWDGVLFEILNPSEQNKLNNNNNSCVLKISTLKHTILLTADIEIETEEFLINTIKSKLDSDILIVPHHGSKTSSSHKFLQAVSPNIAIVSSGFKNKYKHPNNQIINRYKKYNIEVLNTSCTGQIEIYLKDKITINKYRENNARYYMRQCAQNYKTN